MNVLITGHAGFVGSHFLKRLLDEGYNVVGVDIRMHKPNWLLEMMKQPKYVLKFEYVWDDLRRFVTIEQADSFDLIIHCAAVVGGRLNIDGDPLGVATNLAIDSDFFNWIARGKKKKRVVYFSSAAVYPVVWQTRKDPVLLSENMLNLDGVFLGMPDQTYGFAKLAGELLAHKAVKDYGVDVVIYRPFGGYGDDQDLTYPFPAIIKRVVDREKPVVVWGSGDQERDFIHIDDIVEAVLTTYNQLAPGQVLNLGTGKATSFKKLAGIACHIEKHYTEIVNDPTKPEGVFSRVANVTEMLKYFEPRVALESGIQRALAMLTPPGKSAV